MDELVKILHKILDLLPFRQEADHLELRDQVANLSAPVAETPAEPVGRNTTPSGVVTGDAPTVDTHPED